MQGEDGRAAMWKKAKPLNHHVEENHLLIRNLVFSFTWINNKLLSYLTHCPFQGLLVTTAYIALVNTMLNKHDIFLWLSLLLFSHDPAQNASSLVRLPPNSLSEINESFNLCAPRVLTISPVLVTNWVVNSLFPCLVKVLVQSWCPLSKG